MEIFIIVSFLVPYLILCFSMFFLELLPKMVLLSSFPWPLSFVWSCLVPNLQCATDCAPFLILGFPWYLVLLYKSGVTFSGNVCVVGAIYIYVIMEFCGHLYLFTTNSLSSIYISFLFTILESEKTKSMKPYYFFLLGIQCLTVKLRKLETLSLIDDFEILFRSKDGRKVKSRQFARLCFPVEEITSGPGATKRIIFFTIFTSRAYRFYSVKRRGVY